MAVEACTALPTGRERALVMAEAQEKICLAKERAARAEEAPFWQSRGGGKHAAPLQLLLHPRDRRWWSERVLALGLEKLKLTDSHRSPKDSHRSQRLRHPLSGGEGVHGRSGHRASALCFSGSAGQRQPGKYSLVTHAPVHCAFAGSCQANEKQSPPSVCRGG